MNVRADIFNIEVLKEDEVAATLPSVAPEGYSHENPRISRLDVEGRRDDIQHKSGIDCHQEA